jgi:hypothetical protein
VVRLYLCSPRFKAAARGPASPARIFVCVPEWFGQFDIEIDCIAMV